MNVYNGIAGINDVNNSFNFQNSLMKLTQNILANMYNQISKYENNRRIFLDRK